MLEIKAQYGGFARLEYNQLSIGRDGKRLTIVLTDGEMRALVMALLLQLFQVRGS